MIDKYLNQVTQGDCLEVMKGIPDESVHCIVTSPPYWALRDYGVDGQMGLEDTPDAYIQSLCDVFDEAMRILKKDGTCWVNLGDTYNNATKWTYNDGAQTMSGGNARDLHTGKKGTKELPEKCLAQIPSRFAIEMTRRGWVLRNEIIWYKPNCMPSSATDRFTVDFEKIFFFVKSQKYHFEQQFEQLANASVSRLRQNIKQQAGSERANGGGKTNGNMKAVGNFGTGRNKRCVWRIAPKAYKEAHFATFPPELPKQCIAAGCPENGVVLDMFGGSGTTAYVAREMGRDFIHIDLNPDYCKIAESRLAQKTLL